MKRLLVGLLLIAALPSPAAHGVPTTLVGFHCGGSGGRIEAMENSYIAALGNGNCWAHLGHHTYDAGGLYAVGAISGRVFTVEVQLTPPTELLAPEPPEPQVLPLPLVSVFTYLSVEASVDGITWESIGQIPYNLRGSQRQEIFFDVDGGGTVARYLRIRQPRSAAQGLSGYLDSSRFDAELTPALPPPVAVRTGPQTYRCQGDVMERFFDTHPCWFGGINRYDAPSVFHTYPIHPGIAEVTRIQGSAAFAPWRSDDYFDDGADPLSLQAEVQTSVDGVTWTTVSTIQGVYGTAIDFDIDGLDGLAARFVRIVAERHHGYTRHPALKHVRGMLIDSSITVHAPTLR